MATTTREVAAAPERVFAVLADGWLYPSWVVGATRMRAVEPAWPAPQSKLHHSVGVWPLMINDETIVLAWEPGSRMVLKAKGWPLGTAIIELDVSPTPAGCVVRITEEADEGPGRLLPKIIRDPMIAVRNVETLRRLALLAEGGAAT